MKINKIPECATLCDGMLKCNGYDTACEYYRPNSQDGPSMYLERDLRCAIRKIKESKNGIQAANETLKELRNGNQNASATELFDMWENCYDKYSFSKLFEISFGIDFGDYLNKCLEVLES